MIYWDTSCVLKLYAQEDDSDRWTDMALRAGAPLVSSALLSAELAFAFEQKELRGELRKGGSRALGDRFLGDTGKGRFRLYPIGSDVLAESVRMAARCYRARPPVALRTLDGLHLATARLARCDTVATTDRRMRSAAIFLAFALPAT